MKHWLILFLSLVVSANVFAESFDLPANDDALIGQLQYTTAPGEYVPNVAHRYNLGQNAIVAANPGVLENGRVGQQKITVPTEYLLPPLPRNGIVVNLSEMRMYYYPKGSHKVMTFPIGIGKIGKTIPIVATSITRKVINPSWTPPEDIRQFNRDQGIELPKTMGPGPDNPLGPFAIYLRVPTFLIHSTIFPESIGRRASFGCLRMNEDDIKQFFPIVAPGTPVEIVDMPTKVAWQSGHLYVEAHPPLEERNNAPETTFPGMVQSVQDRLPKNRTVLVNWQMLSYLSENPDGIPHEIGVAVN